MQHNIVYRIVRIVKETQYSISYNTLDYLDIQFYDNYESTLTKAVFDYVIKNNIKDVENLAIISNESCKHSLEMIWKNYRTVSIKPNYHILKTDEEFSNILLSYELNDRIHYKVFDLFCGYELEKSLDFHKYEDYFNATEAIDAVSGSEKNFLVWHEEFEEGRRIIYIDYMDGKKYDRFSEKDLWETVLKYKK